MSDQSRSIGVHSGSLSYLIETNLLSPYQELRYNSDLAINAMQTSPTSAVQSLNLCSGQPQSLARVYSLLVFAVLRGFAEHAHATCCMPGR